MSTVQEIGLRGARTSAYGIDPHVGIAVDVTHATDCPTIDQRQGGEISLGRGPVVYRGPNMNPVATARLLSIADEQEIPRQMAALGIATPNDANSMQITRAGVATAVVAIPNRYMHSAVEMISLDDINHAAELLAEFAVSIADDDDFTPSRLADRRIVFPRRLTRRRAARDTSVCQFSLAAGIRESPVATAVVVAQSAIGISHNPARSSVDVSPPWDTRGTRSGAPECQFLLAEIVLRRNRARWLHPH